MKTRDIINLIIENIDSVSSLGDLQKESRKCSFHRLLTLRPVRPI